MIHQQTPNSINNNSLNMTNSNEIQKKKKRRNKKKKVTKVVEENSSDSESDIEDLTFIAPPSAVINKGKPKPSPGSYHANQLDDPVTVTIKQVMSKSNYSHDRVASCVNRMWDTGLQYDSTEAVLAELQREDDKKVEEQDDYDEILDGKRRVGTNPPVPSLPPPVQVQVSQSSTKPKSEPTFAKPPAVPSISFGRHTISPIPPQAPAVSAPPKTDPQPPLSLSSRLEIIASHDDFTQGLIALNSWCKITPNATMSFFQHDCYAIEIILQRFCTQPSLIHESCVRTQFTELLSFLLPRPSLKVAESSSQSDHIQNLLTSFTSLLDQAARSTALKIATPLTSSSSVSGSQTSRLSPLALRLGQSLRKIHQTYEKTRATFNESGSIFTIDEDIKNLADSINKMQLAMATTGVGMKERFELRELIFEAFQLQIKKIEAIQKEKTKSANSVTDIHLPSTISYSQQENFALENAILLASGDSRRNIDALKLQASSSKSYYEKLFHDHETRLIPYQNDLKKLQLQIHDLEAKKTLLLAELSKIDEEMTNIVSKTATIQNFLTELQTQHEKQINTLNSSHGHVVDALEKDNQLNHLFTNLKSLEHVMDEISTIGLDSLSSLSTTVHDTIKTDSLVDTFVNYSAVEAKCIEFLTKRIVLMKEKISYSEREVTEYKNLGMTNLAAEISLSIERMKENISEDVAALQSLQNTVCELLTSLHTAVRNHAIVRAMPSQSLQDIVANLQTVGIALRPELAPYNIPLSPPGLSTPSHAPPQKPPPSANLETSVEPVKSLSQVSVDEKLNLSNKPKSSDKKATDRSEKKAAPEKKAATEKKLSDKPELEKQEKKEKKTPNAPSEAPVVPVKGKGSQNGPQTAPGKEKKVSKDNKEIPPTKSAPALPTEVPLPQRTNTRRKPTPAASEAPETPKKAAEPTPSSVVTPPPGLTKGPETKPTGWSGWATIPTKKGTGSLAQIQAEQASAKKLVENQPQVSPPPVSEFPPLNETKDEDRTPPVQEILETPNPEPTTTASPETREDDVDPDNPDARSDISVRGDADDLDDDDDLESKSPSIATPKEIVQESTPESTEFPSLVPEEITSLQTPSEIVPPVVTPSEDSEDNSLKNEVAQDDEPTVEITTELEVDEGITSSKFDY